MFILLKKIHTYLYRGAVATVFVILWPFLYAFSHKMAHFYYMNKVRRVFAFFSSGLLGMFYQVRYEEEIDWSKPYIICANHTSNLDISAVILAVKGNFRFMGKDELLDNFVTGFFFRTIDIPVNRNSKMSSFRAFKKAEESLQHGISVVIFPEGRIPDDYPPVLDTFKNGSFRLAIGQKVPIIPITITNGWQMMWDDGGMYGSRPGICDIYVHPPVETASLDIDDAEQLKYEVRRIIAQKLTFYAA